MAKLLDAYGQPYSDRFVTPKWLCDLLPTVDLDPCSDPRAHVRARRCYSLEKGLDGKKLPWRGSVYMNHPYSDPMPWMEKLSIEMSEKRCTEAIVLAKLDCSTAWWKKLMGVVAWSMIHLWLFRDRIQFDEPPELISDRLARGRPETSSNNFCSAIIHLTPGARLEGLDQVADRWARPSE